MSGSAANGGPGWELVAAAAERRRELAAKLDAMSRVQSARIAAGDHDAAVEVLGEREAVVEEIAALSAGLGREPWAPGGANAAQSEAGAARVRRSLEEADALLAEVARRDAADLGRLRAARDALGAELGGTTRALAAQRAYGGAAGGARVQDREV